MHASPLVMSIALLLLSPAAMAQTPPPADLTGHWHGSLTAEGKEIEVDVDVVKNSQGLLSGVVNIPAYSVKSHPLTNFSVDGRSVGFQLVQSEAGNNVFVATLAPDGASMAGTFTHDVYTMPFTLGRTGAPAIQPPAASTAIDKGLEGKWDGVLEVEGKQLRVTLKLSNGADGIGAGTLVSVDQNNATYPITTITQAGTAVTLGIQAVGGTYRGLLDAAAAQLTGTWTQGPAALPLTFRRGATSVQR